MIQAMTILSKCSRTLARRKSTRANVIQVGTKDLQVIVMGTVTLRCNESRKAANEVTGGFHSNSSKLKVMNKIVCFRLGWHLCADLVIDFGPRMVSAICYSYMNIGSL